MRRRWCRRRKCGVEDEREDLGVECKGEKKERERIQGTLKDRKQRIGRPLT